MELHVGDVTDAASLEGAAPGRRGRLLPGPRDGRRRRASPSASRPARATSPGWPSAKACGASSTSAGSATRASPSTCAAATGPPRSLAAEGPPLTYFRAAMVVGAGSESYRTLRYLVRAAAGDGRARAGCAPRPSRSGSTRRSSTCGARPRSPSPRAGRSQIGGPDVLSYAEMLDRMAVAMGKRPRPQGRGPARHALALVALAGPGHPGRHQGRAAPGRGPDDEDRGHRSLGRGAVRGRAGVVRRGAAAGAGGGGGGRWRVSTLTAGRTHLFTHAQKVPHRSARARRRLPEDRICYPCPF